MRADGRHGGRTNGARPPPVSCACRALSRPSRQVPLDEGGDAEYGEPHEKSRLLPYRGSAMLTMMVSATAIKAAAHSRKRAGRPRLTGASGPPASPTQRARSLPALV